MYNHMVVQCTEPELDQIFRALAAQTRRDIIRRTLKESVSVSALADRYAMSFAAVQKHVAVLERAGLVRKQAEGRARLVSAVPEQLARAQACLDRLADLWRHRVDALDALFADEQE